MRALRAGRASRAVVVGFMLFTWLDAPLGVSSLPPAAVAGDSSATPTPTSAQVSIGEARELIKSGDYDRAIERLKAALVQSRNDPERQRVAYLQLIKAYVFLGNDYKFKPQGREAASLNYREARERIAEALAIPALRHMRPEPATDFPPEMIAFFADVRAQLFSAFRVIELDPATAVVLLDGDTLRHPGTGAALGETGLPIGRHHVTVRSPGYVEVVEDVVLSPGATVERRYRLDKKRGAWWYASRGGAVAGLIGGAVALFAGKDGGGTTTATLPGAPPPPTR
jgi:hypothetical protein